MGTSRRGTAAQEPLFGPTQTNGPTHYKTSTGDEFWFDAGNGGYGYSHREPQRVETKPPKLYKALAEDGKAPIATTGFVWPLPMGKKPGKWVQEVGHLVFCQRGLHAFDGEHWTSWVGKYPHIYEIEFDGAVAYDQQKWLGARARLVREIDVTPLINLARSNILAHKLGVAGRYYYGSDVNLSEDERRFRAWKDEQTAEVVRDLRDDWNFQFTVVAIERIKAEGGDTSEAETAIKGGPGSWQMFLTILEEKRRAANALLRAEQRVSRVIDGESPGKARESTRALVLKWASMSNAFRAIPHLYAFKPWEQDEINIHYSWSNTTVIRADVVGEDWLRKYRRRAKAKLASLEAELRAQWASIPDDLTFERAIEMIAEGKIAAVTPVKKRRGR